MQVAGDREVTGWLPFRGPGPPEEKTVPWVSRSPGAGEVAGPEDAGGP